MISVIIPALNEEEALPNCLVSLTSQSIARETYEIIVVDGASSDNTREIAEVLADKVISQKRAGIGGARGAGVAVAKGNILVFTDADTRHPSTWLETIREDLTSGGYDVCTGPVRFYDRTLRSGIVQVWRKYYLLLHWFGFYWLIGSNFAVKKDAYIRAGGHRDISLLEDYDLSLSLFAAGSRCFYDRRTSVFTSTRRLEGLFRYTATYLTGYYHYHITGNEAALLRYSHPHEIALQRFVMPGDLKQAREKISTALGKIIAVSLRLD